MSEQPVTPDRPAPPPPPAPGMTPQEQVEYRLACVERELILLRLEIARLAELLGAPNPYRGGTVRDLRKKEIPPEAGAPGGA